MLHKEIIVQSAALLRTLNEAGFDCEAEDDFARITRWLAQEEKLSQNPKISLVRNDFVAGSAFWTFLLQGEDRVGRLAARYYDLNGETLGSYLERTSNAQFGGGREVVDYIAPSVSQLIGGRLIFFGDLEVSLRTRTSRKTLSAYARLTMVLSGMTWPDFDWMYGFVTKQHARQAELYGFTYRVPRVVTWKKPIPEGREDTHVLVAIPAADFWHMLRTGEMSEL
ncbi:hypothetical protein N4R57_00055 [Rhodobacteraceae bacterium D3-12]|nr:hypothetical protein N4R57_00055 [Rhodobacteraceae bacterium D3-12]